jgi:hypothetical protein
LTDESSARTDHVAKLVRRAKRWQCRRCGRLVGKKTVRAIEELIRDDVLVQKLRFLEGKDYAVGGPAIVVANPNPLPNTNPQDQPERPRTTVGLRPSRGGPFPKGWLARGVRKSLWGDIPTPKAKPRKESKSSQAHWKGAAVKVAASVKEVSHQGRNTATLTFSDGSSITVSIDEANRTMSRIAKREGVPWQNIEKKLKY